LLTLTIKPAQSESNPVPGLTDPEADDAVSFLPATPVTVGQGLTVLASSDGVESGDVGKSNATEDLNLLVMRIYDALDRFHHEPLDQLVKRDRPAVDRTQPVHALSEPWNPARGEQEFQGRVGTDENFAPGTNQGQVIYYQAITEFPATPASVSSETD